LIYQDIGRFLHGTFSKTVKQTHQKHVKMRKVLVFTAFTQIWYLQHYSSTFSIWYSRKSKRL